MSLEQTIYLISAISSFFIGILSGFLYFYFQKKRKNNSFVHAQKAETIILYLKKYFLFLFAVMFIVIGIGLLIIFFKNV